MSDPFLAEIRAFGFPFAPRGWALCNGSTLPVAQNTALFALLGTNYGGDGRSTFGLPNLQGNLPVHVGGSTGPGLQQWSLGQQQGTETVTLTTDTMAAHNHAMAAQDTAAGSTPTAAGAVLGLGSYTTTSGRGVVPAYTAQAPDTQMAPGALTPLGNGQPHNNLMPYLSLNFCIATQGLFPRRP